MVEMRNAYKTVVAKPERKRQFESPRHKWDYNIEMILKEKDFRVWIGFILLMIGDNWWALVSNAMNLQVLHKAGNFLTS
jgi:hypothetical protein